MSDQKATEPADTEGQQTPAQFSQADIERIVKERIERAKAKYADYDVLKARAARLDEIERAQMDEKERLAADLKALEDKVAAAEKARDEALAQSQERLVRSEITALAATMGFRYPADVFRLIDLSEIGVDDAGGVTNAKETLERLAQERPDYLSKSYAPSLDGAAGRQDGGNLPRLTAEQERTAKALEISPDAYAKRLAQQQ